MYEKCQECFNDIVVEKVVRVRRTLYQTIFDEELINRGSIIKKDGKYIRVCRPCFVKNHSHKYTWSN